MRQLGRELGLPEYLVSRQPFPGPGLAIRILGDVTKEKADTLRLADFIFRDELAKAGPDQCPSQYFAGADQRTQCGRVWAMDVPTTILWPCAL